MSDFTGDLSFTLLPNFLTYPGVDLDGDETFISSVNGLPVEWMMRLLPQHLHEKAYDLVVDDLTYTSDLMRMIAILQVLVTLEVANVETNNFEVPLINELVQMFDYRFLSNDVPTCLKPSRPKTLLTDKVLTSEQN